MITGIEVSGLVLGLFPIVIEGIKFYISSAEDFQETVHHKFTLDVLRRELEIEESVYVNTLHKLASRAGIPITPNMVASRKIPAKVLDCLPDYAQKGFAQGCQELNTMLKQLEGKFKKYEQNQAGYGIMFTMLKHFSKEDRDQWIDRIHRLNSSLYKLVNGAPPITAVETNIPHAANVARHYQRVRNHAMTLYGALKEKLQVTSCRCKVPLNEKIHRANLHLDMRALRTHDNSQNNHAPPGERLSLFFPVLAGQGESEDDLTLRKLEFGRMENSGFEQAGLLPSNTTDQNLATQSDIPLIPGSTIDQNQATPQPDTANRATSEDIAMPSDSALIASSTANENLVTPQPGTANSPNSTTSQDLTTSQLHIPGALALPQSHTSNAQAPRIMSQSQPSNTQVPHAVSEAQTSNTQVPHAVFEEQTSNAQAQDSNTQRTRVYRHIRTFLSALSRCGCFCEFCPKKTPQALPQALQVLPSASAALPPTPDTLPPAPDAPSPTPDAPLTTSDTPLPASDTPPPTPDALLPAPEAPPPASAAPPPVPEAQLPEQSSLGPSAQDQIIRCLCTAIKNITAKCTCVGILVGNSNNSQHQVWVPNTPLAMPTAKVVSLADLMSLPEPPTRRERLKLGVRLASSVLQFHETEWLQERWGKQDIYLIQGVFSQSKSPSLETPVICRAFPPKPSALEDSTESNIISCSLSLFSLGIVLIELWFWRSVESFQANTSDTYDNLEDLDTARFSTARKLIKRLYGDAGDIYGDVVRRCITGLDHKENQLENDEFKTEVYLKVLQPLEKYLEMFCSRSPV